MIYTLCAVEILPGHTASQDNFRGGSLGSGGPHTGRREEKKSSGLVVHGDMKFGVYLLIHMQPKCMFCSQVLCWEVMASFNKGNLTGWLTVGVHHVVNVSLLLCLVFM